MEQAISTNNVEIPLSINYEEYLKIKKDAEENRMLYIRACNNHSKEEFMWRSDEHNYKASIRNLLEKIEKLEKRKWWHLW
jgi:hypothetical protein